MDQYTERRTIGLGSRLVQSVKGMLAGLILFLAAFPLLWINEGYALRTARSLRQGAREVVNVPADRIDPAKDGKLVHVAGRATTTETVADSEFNVSVNAIKLRRKVEMYQWKETKSNRSRKNAGGSETTTTTYKYDKVWSEQPSDSSNFKHPGGHENPGMPIRSADFVAGRVTLGAFRLNPNQIGELTGSDPVDVSAARAPDSIRGQAHPISSGFQTGDAGSPQVGDLRITFSQVKPGDVSVVARQASDTFEPFRADAGGTVELVAMGIQSAEAMFETAQTHNSIRTWILRAVGLIVMFIGLMLLLNPLATLGDAIPLVGGLFRTGVGLISFSLALCISLLTIAVAWIAYRPLVGAGLLAGAALLAYLTVRARRSAARKTARARAAVA